MGVSSIADGGNMNLIQWIIGTPQQAPDLSGLAILERARLYLERYGEGKNFEYVRARQILTMAQARVRAEL